MMRFLPVFTLCAFLSCISAPSNGQKPDTTNKKVIIYDNHGKIIIDNTTVNNIFSNADVVGVSDSIAEATTNNLKALKDKYPYFSVDIMINSVSTMRDTVAKTLLKFISPFRLGAYSETVILMETTNVPFYFMCNKNTLPFVNDFMVAIRPLFKGKGEVIVYDDNRKWVDFRILGTPFYDKNGTITIR
jgi:hypothetical protein